MMKSKVIQLTETPQHIDIDALTEKTLIGEGILDTLLQTLRIHLDREFNGKRIQGPQYSEVYTKLWINVLQEAIQLMLAKEKQAYELANIEADTALKQAQTKAILDKLPYEIANIEADTELKKAQVELAKAELEIKKMQLEIEKQKLEIAKQELEIKKVELEIRKAELELAKEQVALIRAKVKTELAQTDGTNINPSSVLGTNNRLLEAQIKGFYRDAEQKAAQLMLQTWITRANNDSALTGKNNLLQDAFIGKFVEKLAMGVNIDLSKDYDPDWTPPNP